MMTVAVVSYSVDSFSKQKTSLNKHMQIQSYRGDEQGRSCRHGRGEEHGREGSSPWGLGVAGGEGFQSRTSRTAAASRRRAGPAARELGTSRGRAGEEQRRSRTGVRSRTCGIWPRAGLAARESLLILPRLGLVAARGPPRRLAPRCSTMPLVAATGFAQRLGACSRRVVAA